MRAWNERNPEKRKKIEQKRRSKPGEKEKQKERVLKLSYGLSLEEFNALLEAQNYVCAICKKPETATAHPGRKQWLAVDHDHTTGRVRGLLCSQCNRSLGGFQDSVMILKRAIDYMER